MLSRSRILSLLAIASLGTLASCLYAFTEGYLVGDGAVLQADGRTPLTRLALTGYQWVVSYTDGSTVAIPVAPTSPLVTDDEGKFNFRSGQLSLVSGTPVQRCTSVCVQQSVAYQDVCDQWGYGYDRCTAWYYDEFGNPYCASWEPDPSTYYCISGHREPYTYCSAYGQDCRYYYPSRQLTDIASAYSEITFRSGGAEMVTASSSRSLPAAALRSTRTENGNRVTTTDTWTQADTYVTGVQTRISPITNLTTAQQAVITAHNAGRTMPAADPARIPSRTHAPATYTPYEDLSAEAQVIVRAARAAGGATPQ